jgi:hypothetical protein
LFCHAGLLVEMRPLFIEFVEPVNRDKPFQLQETER